MNAADFAVMANPIRNPQFRRNWVSGPPDTDKRERRPGQGAALEVKSNSNSAATLDEQVRRLQVAWKLT